MLRGPRAHDLDATESNAFDSQLTQASISSTAGVGGNRRRSSTADSTSSAAERADRKRAAYAVLLELDDKRKAKVKRFSSQRIEYDDDEGGSLSPKFDKLLQDRGPNGILRLTNFSPEEINAFWSSELRSYMTKKWNAGPGRKSEITAKDAFVMVLMSLKHCGNWDIVATACEEATSTFEHQVNAAFKLLHSFLYKHLVVDAEAKWNMHQLAISGRQFTHYPCARYATDVTFLHTNAPSGSNNEHQPHAALSRHSS